MISKRPGVVFFGELLMRLATTDHVVRIGQRLGSGKAMKERNRHSHSG